MTSLFFIVLVLYVLTYVKLKHEQLAAEKQQKATEEQLRKIQEIQAAVKELPRQYFAYDSTYKRFSLVKNIEFELQQDIIRPQYIGYLLGVGRSIQNLINTLNSKYSNMDIKYVVVIEGMASRDNYPDNYSLSYKRALALLNLWQEHNIRLDQSVCEVQIAGSGIGGIGRFRGKEEYRNQRILIQVVPKIGTIKIE
jgi:outer membrane protein OmpA-like peptidoglycan-associated protein